MSTLTSLDFHKLKTAVASQFQNMAASPLFCTEIDKDEIWQTYLGSFPKDSNPIFRKRAVHDCSCCRAFIRTIGGVVAIKDDKIVSIWDCKVKDPDYQMVVDAMATYVKNKRIVEPFLHYERHVGTDKSLENMATHVQTWNHFFVQLPHQNEGSVVVFRKKDIPTLKGDARTTYDVMLRSLQTLTRDAIDTVLELIKQGSLYRGNEQKPSVETFSKLKREFDTVTTKGKVSPDIFVWSRLKSVGGSVARIRNTAIGTLLIDLSNGVDLETAVRSFERVMAPENYKRPTALVTQAMVEKARATVEELGLTAALDRRFANLTDISVNNIIFADRQARKSLKDNVFDTIPVKKSTGRLDRVEEIPIEKFITDIVPNISSMEVMFENKHRTNLVSLIAPRNLTSMRRLFKWDNNFSWTYNGDVTDSIKERVKQAGGNVTGDLCCRLAWYNYDDLDLHLLEPESSLSGYGHIYFGNRQSHSFGKLDVDMNAGSGKTREPVENIYYENRRRMKEGIYRLWVNQYSARETDNPGFEVEIDYLGQVTRFEYPKRIRTGDNVQVASFWYNHEKGLEILESLDGKERTQTLWGITSQQFHRVNLFLLSPNHWDGQQGIGNKHYFFMLEGCVNDTTARGFFNEYLRAELDQHRKVLEIVGSKMKTEATDNQLSGLGFSDTKRAEVTVRVEGNFTRTLKVII